MIDPTLEGIIVKGIAGFYYVSNGNSVFECKARGVFRNNNISPIVGDKVIVQIIDVSNFKGNIIEILPRRNELIRPKVSNIDQAVIVFASSKPDINMDLLDRFIIVIEQQNIDIILCINKIDLDNKNILDNINKIYNNSGYKVIGTSVKTSQGIFELKQHLKNKITVFAGPSGVGKSSILNNLDPKLDLKTGEISAKIQRGKHTTRHAELIEITSGGYIVDSPGFTSLHIENIDKDDLQNYFKEFDPFIGNCKFNMCSHTHEPGCAIIDEVGKSISYERYERYKLIYLELEEKRRRKYD